MLSAAILFGTLRVNFFSVRLIFLFHQMKTKSSIFTSGKATYEKTTLNLVFMSEIKNDLSLKKSKFLFLLCLKIAIIQFIAMRQP